MNIDDIAYELYIKNCDKNGYDYILFDLFCIYKKSFKSYYNKALIIEREYKLNKIMK